MNRAEFCEMFCYMKQGRMRRYSLRDLPDGPELWVHTAGPRKALKSRRLVRFEKSDNVAAFLSDVEQTLRAGGWQFVDC